MGKKPQELQEYRSCRMGCGFQPRLRFSRFSRFRPSLRKGRSECRTNPAFARSILQLLNSFLAPPHPADFSLARPLLPAIFRSPSKTLSSSGLGHRPFTAVTRVRIPLGSLSAIRRANPLQQRIHSLLQSASINQRRQRCRLHFAIF
jgi:hypothetical protein